MKDRELYFKQLADTSRSHYIDFIRQYKDIGTISSILEIGCGEGGNLLPFAELGCNVTGIDMAGGKIENARKFFNDRGQKGVFICADFLEENLLNGLFDIIIIHDVIEHIEPENKKLFFDKIREYLQHDGIVFFGFPAWQMPFGGHQQVCKSRMCRAPWLHLLPKSLYRGYLNIFKEDPAQIDGLMSIRRSKMTVESFEKLSCSSGYRILNRKLWLINPHYHAKFGFRPVTLWNCMSRLPYIRNYLSTSCHYILSAEK